MAGLLKPLISPTHTFSNLVPRSCKLGDLMKANALVKAACVVGIAASLAMLAGSATMNWQFGASIGKTPFDSNLYGGVSVAIDIFLAVTLIFAMWNFQSRRYSQAVIAVSVWLLFTAFSLLSATGYTAASRSALMNTESSQTTIYNSNRQALAADTKRLESVRGELATIAAIQKRRGYLRGSEKRNRANLLAEQKQLKTDIRQYKKDLGFDTVKINQANTVSSQVAIYSNYLNVKSEDVSSGITLFFAIVLQLGAGLGLWVSSSPLMPSRKEPEKVPAPTPQPVHEVTPEPTPKGTPEPVEEVTPEYTRLGSGFVQDGNVIKLERRVKSQKQRKKKTSEYHDNQAMVREFLEGCDTQEFKPKQGWGLFKEQYPHAMRENQFYAAMKALANKGEVRRKKVSGETKYEIAA